MNTIQLIMYTVGGTTFLLVIAGFLAKNLILTRLTNAVSHEFDAKLENLKAELRSKEAEIAAIRETAATLTTGRGQAVEERRLDAIDSIWRAFGKAKKHSWAIHTMTVLNVEEVAKAIESDSNMQEFFQTIAPFSKVDGKDLDTIDAQSARLWVTGLAWAYYNAYVTMAMYCVSWLQSAKTGLDPTKYFSHEGVNKLLAAAIPEVSIDEKKLNNHLFIHAGESLESKLVLELRASIDGAAAEQDAIIKAKQIVAAAGHVNDDLEEATKAK